ncbi:Dabb family protein [Lichenifustis flavocetrariae]|uniref:Dabb family protein n=1 Tax=Lichenifustis flavocetrariae TaxID=2949735 RepID=A0AA41YTT5_9HYPH|nr:Dabb family protein [Lichenifustis flavocetrariae]MCW6508451.1 Dabb family protein [Lichenifustis flavocetrariae]
MIRHIVLVRFAEETHVSEQSAIFAELAALRTIVPGMLTFAAGANVSPEGLARGFTHAFTVDFASEASRDAYLQHPAHQAAGGKLVQAAKGGLDGILVVDVTLSGDAATPGA